MRRIALIALLPLLSNCAASTSSAPAPEQPTPPPAQPAEPAPAPQPAPAAEAPPAPTPAQPAPKETLGAALQQHPLVQEQLGFYAVVTPPEYDAPDNAKKRFPVVVVLHDGGQTETSAALFANALGREGVIYVIPRAPYPSSQQGGGYSATPNYPSSWGNAQAETFPNEDLGKLQLDKLHATQIANAIKDARKRYRADWSKVVVVGHGEGATQAHLFAINQPWMVKAYVASGGSYEPTTEEKRGAAHVAAIKSNQIAAMLIHQEGDPVAGPASAKKLGEMFDKGRVDHKMLILPGGDHQLAPDAMAAAKRFVRHHCCGEPLEAPAPETPAPAAASAAPAAAQPGPAKPAPAQQPAAPKQNPPKAAPKAAPAPQPAPAKPAAPQPKADAPVASAPPTAAQPAEAPKAKEAPAKKDVPAKATVPTKPKAPAAQPNSAAPQK